MPTLSGWCRAHGYWRRPDVNDAAFTDGWFHTGDIRYLDADGYLYLVDRAKDMIIRAGENVYCVEVEHVLFDHPGVIDAAVIEVPHKTLGEEVKAVVQLRADATTTPDELRRVLPGTPRRLQGTRLRRNPAGTVAAQPRRQSAQERTARNLDDRDGGRQTNLIPERDIRRDPTFEKAHLQSALGTPMTEHIQVCSQIDDPDPAFWDTAWQDSGHAFWPTPAARPWRRDVWNPACVSVGFGEMVKTPKGTRRYSGLVPHELRHAAASFAIASGASVKGVQAMLGHVSATQTLDPYRALWPDELAAVAERIDAARNAEISRANRGLSVVEPAIRSDAVDLR